MTHTRLGSLRARFSALSAPDGAAAVGKRIAAWWSVTVARLRGTRRPTEVLLLVLAIILAAVVLYALTSPIHRRH